MSVLLEAAAMASAEAGGALLGWAAGAEAAEGVREAMISSCVLIGRRNQAGVTLGTGEGVKEDAHSVSCAAEGLSLGSI